MSDMNPSPEFEEKIRRALDVPDANPAFVNQLRKELVRGPVKVKPRFIFRPAWAVAFVLVLAVVLISVPGVAAAIGRLFGYVPGVGLVENTGNLRILSEPVSLTRDGVTLTIDSVYAYEDRVEVAYSVTGIAAQNDGAQADDATTNPTAFCGGVEVGDTPNTDGDARLLLPDGTVLERDQTGKYPQNVFAMKPVYAATVPASVTKMTLVLDCIPWARRDVVPEGWSVPFELKSIPAGTVVGVPVIEVNATSVPVTIAPTYSPAGTAETAPAPGSTKLDFTLEQAVQTASGPIFYIRLHVENPDPTLKTAFPRDVYVIDSLGQKIQYLNNTPYSEDPATIWEYVPTANPAAGPLTLVLNDAVLRFSPTSDASFSFDTGDNPQHNQTWDLNEEFDIAGHKVQILSARATIFDDIKDNPDIWDPNGGPDYPEGSQGFDKGYQFAIQYTEPGMGISLDIQSDNCGLTDVRPAAPSTSVYYTQLCRDGYPKGNVRVTLGDLSVVVKNIGQVIWSPEGAALPARPVTMNLKRIVPLDSGTVVYFSLDMENKDPSLVSIMPLAVYAIDSQGQKTQMRGNFTWQPFEHRAGSDFEFVTQSKPAAGPLTIVVEKAVAYYAPLHVEPPQAAPADMEFIFDAGEKPQPGQSWSLDRTINIAGYPIRVTSARATTYDEVKSQNPDFYDSQGFEYGYDFTLETDPSVKIQVEMDIMSEAPICGLSNSNPFAPYTASLNYIQLCREKFPTGKIKVQIWQLAVLLENTWQATWQP